MKSTRSVSSRPAGRCVLALVALVVALAINTSGASAKSTPHIDIVSQSGPPGGPIPPNTTYFTTIQAAVEATSKGDWVLIEPGTYTEEVTVTKAHSGIHIRGMNRNTVILDGQHKPKPEGSNGILITQANNVWVENLTVRNFDRATPDGPGGNEIWWTGAPLTEDEGNSYARENTHGWWGSYLTAYDDGLSGGYGIFAQHEKEGSWENIYSSGFNDSGIYIGGCWECKARVSKATIEYNAAGYSGSNSGGSLVIEKSTFRKNSAGIVPNGEDPGDRPPPQNGVCNPPRPRTPYYLFTSTDIEHCTVIKENLVEDNNDLEVPANASTEIAPWGVGVELPGDMGDLVENNKLVDNVNNGVLGFEYPNPYPPVSCTKKQKEEGCNPTIYFQFTGNKIAGNTFEGNGTSGKALASDIALQGGIFSHGIYTSDNDCAAGNTDGAGLTTFPADLEGTWGCQNSTTPPPENGIEGILYVQTLSEESAYDRKGVGQPDPGPQPTMPEPCQGVPANPLCPSGGSW